MSMTRLEIAKELNVTPQRIEQIEKKALRKVKHILLTKYGNSVTLWDILPFWDKENHYEQMQSL